MAILKWTVRIHKWIALIVGLQILLWIAGGLVMSAIPIERVRGEHKIAEHAPHAFQPADLVSLVSATDVANINQLTEAAMGTVIGRPVWRLTDAQLGTFTLDAKTGELLSPVDEDLARQIATADYSGHGTLVGVEWLVAAPTEYGRPGSVWRAHFDDTDNTTLYIDPATAEVRARRSSTWRFYDFFWKLHIMDYNDGAHFNHPLLITAAGTAVFVALSGIILLIIKMRRSLIAWRRRRSRL